MAKDGTNRGGVRPGAGRKKKPLEEKIQDGKKAVVMNLKGRELTGVDTPQVEQYMRQAQKAGIELNAEKIYIQTHNWLKERGCIELVNPMLIEAYALSAARWRQCQVALNLYGFLSKHPTTGAAIASPFVGMVSIFQREMDCSWAQIFQIVKENCSAPYTGNPCEDLMTQILNS